MPRSEHCARCVARRERRGWHARPFARLAIALVVGAASSLGIALVWPTRRYLPDFERGFSLESWTLEGVDPTLMIVGAVAIAVLAYAALGAGPASRRARMTCVGSGAASFGSRSQSSSA